MGTMYDSTTASDIPTSATIVGGYVDGLFAWSADDWARFPNAQQVRITYTASNLDADVLDIESGDATPDQGADWAANSTGMKVVYHSLDTDVPGVSSHWIADWTGSPHMASISDGTVVATQYADPATSGGHFDLSVTADYWPATSAPASTSTPAPATTTKPAAVNAAGAQPIIVIDSALPIQDMFASSAASAETMPESHWAAIVRILAVIGWRCFPVNSNTLVIAPDMWFYNQAPLYTLSENMSVSATTPSSDTDPFLSGSSGVDSIDFDWDCRQPLAELTITCRAEQWAAPIGSVIELGPDMGIAAGTWLVTDIERSLFSLSAKITCDKPLPEITLPSTQAGSTATDAAVASALATNSAGLVDTGGATAQSGSGPSPQVNAMVNFAKSKVGGPYVWGGNGPTGYDCSGLVMAAAGVEGVTLPRNSGDQYAFCVGQGTACTIATGIATYGALLFITGSDGIPGSEHVAISLGDGTCVEAYDSVSGIIIAPVAQDNFTLAALVPGLTY